MSVIGQRWSVFGKFSKGFFFFFVLKNTVIFCFNLNRDTLVLSNSWQTSGCYTLFTVISVMLVMNRWLKANWSLMTVFLFDFFQLLVFIWFEEIVLCCEGWCNDFWLHHGVFMFYSCETEFGLLFTKGVIVIKALCFYSFVEIFLSEDGTFFKFSFVDHGL